LLLVLIGVSTLFVFFLAMKNDVSTREHSLPLESFVLTDDSPDPPIRVDFFLNDDEFVLPERQLVWFV
jgi:hypothetical protein